MIKISLISNLLIHFSYPCTFHFDVSLNNPWYYTYYSTVTSVIAVHFIWIKVHHLILLFVCIAVGFLFFKKLVMLSLNYSSLVRIQSLWFCLVLVVYNKTNVSCHFLLISKLFNKGNIPLRFASLNITYLGWMGE